VTFLNRLVARLEKWHRARRAVHLEVGHDAYRSSVIDVPGQRRIGVHLLGLMICIGLSVLTRWLVAPRVTEARVSETRWHYQVSLRERTPRTAEDWHDEMHVHHYDERCESRVRSYRDCDPYPCPSLATYPCGGHVCTHVVVSMCWHTCPVYDYQWPDWPTIAVQHRGGVDHTPVRPALGGVLPCPEDEEMLAPSTQCTVDALAFTVQFDGGSSGHWGIGASRRA